jgi:hypothetical protein
VGLKLKKRESPFDAHSSLNRTSVGLKLASFVGVAGTPVRAFTEAGQPQREKHFPNSIVNPGRGYANY